MDGMLVVGGLEDVVVTGIALDVVVELDEGLDVDDGLDELEEELEEVVLVELVDVELELVVVVELDEDVVVDVGQETGGYGCTQLR
jgi:hypothetical protein